MSKNIKEINFIKQVEITSKRNAYLAALMYLEHFDLEYAKKVIKTKAEGHTEFLDQLPFVYDYATQTLVEKKDGIDGAKVYEEMNSLMGAVADENVKLSVLQMPNTNEIYEE